VTAGPLPKEEARARAYAALRAAGAARFPLPVEGRIPNFRGAEAAARRLRETEAYRRARALKVNPDAAQLPVRVMALEDGKTLYLAAPRLRGPFWRIRPEDVPSGKLRAAAQIRTREAFGGPVPLEALAPGAGGPPVGLVVVGSVAVAPDGARAGKGEGYADLEYALLRELGYPELPVATTVHPAQIVPSVAMEPHDVPVDLIATPDAVLSTRSPYPRPAEVDWGLLGPRAADAMPPLRELRALRWDRLGVPDVLAPDLAVVFVGINPGRGSATLGHHFGGPGNHFWRLLHEAGWTPRRLHPQEDRDLLELGIGITNVVARPTRGEAELGWPELVEGGQALRARIAACRPGMVVLLGKQVYRAYAGLPRSAPVAWGPQPRQTVPGVREFVAANPSARSTVPYAERLAQFRAIRRLALGARQGRAAGA
jgi:5-formyltetrahydrofolate cyclo-ligase